MRALINASNLHTGGGVQVAISFIYELSLLEFNDIYHLDIIASNEVADGLIRLRFEKSKFKSFKIFDTFGINAFWSKINRDIKNYDIVFTIFGPNYLRVKADKEIVGFAQPWILNFDNPISRELSNLNRYKLKMKFSLQWIFFRRSDHYIVELEHVKKKLNILKKVPTKNINIVHNTVSSLYRNPDKWSIINLKKGKEDISLGIVTRDYAHKNLKILPHVAEALKLEYNINIHFYTTLNDDEWSKKDCFFKRYVSTVGSLSPDQCPSFYQQLDGVIFPSLLECFSATPLEAMVMQKPLFASDRDFVRDVCHDYAIYINPLNADDIAFKIANYFQFSKIDEAKLQKAKQHALSFSSAEERAKKYLKIINNL